MAVNTVPGATFPSEVKQFTTKVDFQDLILAEHVNTLQTEVKALQSALGSNPTVTAGWVGTIDQTTTAWPTVRDRIANLEVGLGGILARLGTGGDIVTSSGTQTLTSKTISGANNTFSNIPGTAVVISGQSLQTYIDSTVAAATTGEKISSLLLIGA